MKKTFKPLEVYAIVATVVLTVLLVLIGTGKLAVLTYQPNLETQGYNWQGWGGSTSASSFADTGGGLIDHTSYVASWSPNLQGGQVTIQGFLDPPFVSACGVPDLWGYRAELYQPSGPLAGWNTILQGNNGGTLIDPMNRPGVEDWANPNGRDAELIVYATGMFGHLGSGPIPATTTYVYINSPDGKTVIPEGSVIHVDFWAHFGVCLGTNTGWSRLSSAEAWVHTGIGSVSWDTDPALYQVGQTATCTWNVGYIGGGQSWNVFVASFARGGTTTIFPTGPGGVTMIQASVVAQSNVSSLIGAITYTVTALDWAPNQGKLYCVLRNNLYSKDFVVAGTVDNTSLSPSLTVKKISPQSPKQGDTVTITWSAAVNPITKAPISKVEVIYGWGGPQYDVILPGNATQYSFVAAQSGYVRFSATAWDAAGRPSGFRNLNIEINAQPPLGGSSGAGPSGGLGFAALVLLLAGLGILLSGYYVIQRPTWRVPFLLIGGVLTFGGIALGLLVIVNWITGLVP